MIERVEDGTTWTLTYNEENRLESVSAVIDFQTNEWISTYDGDGTRVKQVHKINSVVQTTNYYYMGGIYEVEDDGTTQTTLRYYGIGGKRVAMHDGTSLKYFLTDNQGSTVAVLDTTGTILGEQRYKPFGEVRDDVGTITETDFGYTGQRNISGADLMDYNARFYGQSLGRFSQPDTITPNLGNPQTFNRYSYVFNNPIRYTDPSGRCPWCFVVTAIVAVTIMVVTAAIVAVPEVVNAPAITEPRSAPPTSINMSEYAVDTMVANAQASVTGRLRDAWRQYDGVPESAGSLKAWNSLVQTHAVWDLKDDILGSKKASPNGSIILGGRIENFQAVANMHYGFVGAAVGYPQLLLTCGAGQAQYEAYHDKPNAPPDAVGGWDTCRDQPYDNWWIKFGYWLFHQFETRLDDLTADQLEEYLDQYINDNGEPPATPMPGK